MLAFALALLTALAIGAIAFPLFARRTPDAGRSAYNVAVYRDQLAEIDRDRSRGVLDAGQANAARTEIERRLLALDSESDRAARPSIALRRAAIAGAIVLPLLALGYYFATGRPELEARPFAGRDAADESMANAGRLLDALEARLQDKPDDLQGWVLLGQTALRTGRYAQATAALARAVALAPDRADLLASYAEAQILADNGAIGPRAREVLDSALARQPDEPAANYYRGLADIQAGNPRAALERWLALETAAPADAPWLAELQAEIARVAEDSGIDPASLRPGRRPPAPPARGPRADDVERMAQMAPQEREQAIRTMVDGLATRLQDEPDDVAGWLRLGRARMVLGEAGPAADAFKEASQRRPDDPGILADLAEAQLRRTGIDQPPAAEAEGTLRRLLALQPDNGLALFYLARADAAAGDNRSARARLQRLLGLIPADAPQRSTIETLLESLPAGE